jgi:CHC2-type zinc finger protein
MNSIITEAKKNISLIEVVEQAGTQLHHYSTKAKGLCPFHSEKTPSFFIKNDKRWKCYGCHESGDVIDFIRKLHGLSFPDALKYLGIRQGKITPIIRKQVKQRKQRKKLIKAFRQWEVEKSSELGLLIRCIYKVVRSWKSIEDIEDAGELLHLLPTYEYQLELLCSGDDQAKFRLYEEVQQCKNRVLI